VGMAAVLAASARAPLTAILLLFELTRDYRIILPLMAAVGLSVWLVERLKPIARNAETLQSTGLNVQADQGQEILRHLPVSQAMQQNFLTLLDSLPIIQAGLELTHHQFPSALVVDEANQLVGIVTLQDIHKAIAAWEANSAGSQMATSRAQTLADIATSDLLYAYKDEPVSEALARMAARGLRQLPVVDRNASQRLLGVLDQDRINLIGKLAVMERSLTPYLQQDATEDGIPDNPDIALNLPIKEQSAA